MKKIFSLFFILFCFVEIANAQWREPFYSEGDELTELSDSWNYIYADSDGYVRFVDELNDDKDTDWIGFRTHESIFDYVYDFDYNAQYARCIIGFYSNNKLIEKIITEVRVSTIGDFAWISDFKNRWSFASNRSNVLIIEKIIKHLTTIGDVRFVIPRYGAGYFDVTVTKNSELFKNIAK